MVEMGGVAPPSSWIFSNQFFQTENIVTLVFLYQRKKNNKPRSIGKQDTSKQRVPNCFTGCIWLWVN
jgi:hypothetical protein